MPSVGLFPGNNSSIDARSTEGMFSNIHESATSGTAQCMGFGYELGVWNCAACGSRNVDGERKRSVCTACGMDEG